ncbi:MAG: Trx7/PDZ domain-containing (seleno)protein [Planctomycetaceae bacterium]
MRIISILTILMCLSPGISPGQEKKTRDQKVREDQQRVTQEGFWIYNDLPKAFEKARQTGKPIVVVLRCIPCEECVKLDDNLVDTDPVLKPLLEKFVCVRIVSTNGLDLSLFQYDTDQSFAVFMLNADRTIYGRFGTRSHRTEWVGDVSLKGLAEALQGALDLHAGYPANKESLLAKTGPKPLFERPELFPSLKEKYTSTLNYSGDVVKSCIHCHQIGDAIREYYRTQNKPIPDEILNPYPHPRALGLILDPARRATVKDVVSGSLANEAGFRPADSILKLNGQPLLSMADVQWVLNGIPGSGGELHAEIERGGEHRVLTVPLASGWRNLDDISWRVSAWGLRRMVTGGLVFETASAEERSEAGIASGKMLLKVKHVGMYGPHAAGKNAGFQKDDLVVSYDGRFDLLTDSSVLRYGIARKAVGEIVEVGILRKGKSLNLKIPMQP